MDDEQQPKERRWGRWIACLLAGAVAAIVTFEIIGATTGPCDYGEVDCEYQRGWMMLLGGGFAGLIVLGLLLDATRRRK